MCRTQGCDSPIHLTVIEKYTNNSASAIILIVRTIMNVHYHLVFVILQENERGCSGNKHTPVQFNSINVINVTVINCFHRASVLNRVLWTWTSPTSLSDAFLLYRREAGSYISQNLLYMVPREIIQWEALLWGRGRQRPLFSEADVNRCTEKCKVQTASRWTSWESSMLGYRLNSWGEHLIDSQVL